jgi:hypothetical protein
MTRGRKIEDGETTVRESYGYSVFLIADELYALIIRAAMRKRSRGASNRFNDFSAWLLGDDISSFRIRYSSPLKFSNRKGNLLSRQH